MKNGHRFSISSLPRARWNVLDMLTFVGIKCVRAYLVLDIDMAWAESFRKKLAQQGQKVTITAILIKAIALAQRSHPQSRSMFLPFGKRAVFRKIAAGFTVEKLVKDEPAVFFGIIDEADVKPISMIAQELAEYAEKSISELPRLKKEELFTGLPWLFRRLILWTGLQHPAVRLAVNQATFGLTSLGKFGIQSVVSPCACTSTFGVGSVEMRPVAREGEVVSRPMLTLTLTTDQRVMDLAPAARFLCEIRELMEGTLEQYVDTKAAPSDQGAQLVGAGGRSSLYSL